MSYQVLARKWRPRSFASLVGQEHVVRALSHALATGRLHHAWLFTGTRGVGKTTISRILAKALNCETGVSAEPCGQCSACVAIDGDRFPDYVEMDAASNRGVDDMAALLDQAVYAPVQGRYKVYMIDEVHMLTGHAFNAMLKTLEEPPAHVKFILATTDPQKIPVTVLSRCLQFNLKQMPPGHIVTHLSQVLEAEAVPFEPAALRHIAKAAAGSMRDALSLLDQAIAHGAGKVEAEQVANMLGMVGDDHLHSVLEALAVGDVPALLAIADGMQARSLSFDAALQALASLLHRLALMQFAPTALSDPAERARLEVHAAALAPEFLQLAYQIVIHGRDELSLAPDDYAGFTMVLLRLHAFRPESLAPGSASGGGQSRAQAAGAGAVSAPAPPGLAAPQSVALAHAAAPEHLEPQVRGSSAPPPARRSLGDVPPWESVPDQAVDTSRAPPTRVLAPATGPSAGPDLLELPSVAETESGPSSSAEGWGGCDSVQAMLAAGDWRRVCQILELGGMLRELAQHCEWVGVDGDRLRLRLSSLHHHLLDLNPALPGRLGEAITQRIGRPVAVRIELGDIAGETPAQRDAAERLSRHADAVAALESDPFVRELIECFDATLIEASVKPL